MFCLDRAVLSRADDEIRTRDPHLGKVMTTALIIGSESKSDEELSKTLASLRPYASMLVIAGNDDYIEAMLVALRA